MKRRRRRGMNDERCDEVQVVTVVSHRVSRSRRLATRWLRKVNIVASSVRLCARLTASFVVAAYHGWLHKQRSLVRKLRNAISGCSHVFLPSKILLPPISRAAVTHQSSTLDPGCQIVGNPVTIYEPNSDLSNQTNLSEQPEPSVHVEVLHDPSPRPIRADIIFIHGLHGSLFHTWKQGLWGHRKHVKNCPLEHKYKLNESPELEAKSEGNSLSIRLMESEPGSSGSESQSDPDYDHLLENITDLINNIDDKIKESKNGSMDRDTDMETDTEKGQEPYTTCWPRDWVPKDCPGVRVIAVNYTTDPFLWRPIWVHKRIRSSMTLRSRQMEDMLLELGVGEHPVVWVGHSKGGLFVKQMLVDAKNSENPRLSTLLNQTKGIMFYSVPHRGSSLAHWNLPFLRQSVELTEVKKDCREVIELHQKFIKLFEEKSLTAEVFSFVETIMTFMFLTNVRVVSVDSADIGLGSFQGVNIDHREICKPLNRDCFLYKELVNLINRVV